MEGVPILSSIWKKMKRKVSEIDGHFKSSVLLAFHRQFRKWRRCQSEIYLFVSNDEGVKLYFEAKILVVDEDQNSQNGFQLFQRDLVMSPS
jgi:glucose-6-phosphate 1-dehydrogenase